MQLIILGQAKTHCQYTTEGCIPRHRDLFIRFSLHLGEEKIKNYYLKCTAFEMQYFLQLVNFLSTENCFTVLAPPG